MLTEQGCLERRKRLWDALPDDCEWVLIADPRHVLYFANFLVNPISFSTSERGLLLLERSGKATLIAENFTRRTATSEPFVDDEVGNAANEKWYDHKHSVGNRDHALFDLLLSVGDRMKRRGLVEAEWLPAMAADRLGLSSDALSGDVGSVVRMLRRQKHDDEIALLERCMRACEAGHVRALEVAAPGVSELDVYREIQSAAIAEAGCPAIVYGDFRPVNAEIPKRGGLPTTEKLKAGDMLIVDYSIVLSGYRSDFTNTIAIGEMTAEQENIFSVCEGAMAAGEADFKAGAAARGVYNAASAVMEEAGFTPLAHHAGHGLGLGHPESPILVPESDDTLLAGDVVTLEPGMYVEGVGGVRIEHNYLITETGYLRLSNHRIALR
jgi:Xaa-Pro aminopeptidase